MSLEAELARHEGWMLRVAHRLVGEEHTARDLVQDAFLRVLVNPPRGRAPIRGWLWRTLYRLGIDHARKESRRTAKQSGEREEPSAATAVSLIESRSVLATEILALPALHRDLIALRYQRGLTATAAARELGTSETRARRETRLALMALRERLERRFGGEWTLCLAPLLWASRPARQAAVACAGAAAASLVACCLLVGWRASGPGPTSSKPLALVGGMRNDSAGSAVSTPDSVGAHRDGAVERSAVAGAFSPSFAPVGVPLPVPSAQSAPVIRGSLTVNGEPGAGWSVQSMTDEPRVSIARSHVLDGGSWALHGKAGVLCEVHLGHMDRTVEVILEARPGSEDLDLGPFDLALDPLTIKSDAAILVLRWTDGTASVVTYANNEGGRLRFPMAPLGTLSVLTVGEGPSPSTWPVVGWVTNTEDPEEVVELDS